MYVKVKYAAPLVLLSGLSGDIPGPPLAFKQEIYNHATDDFPPALIAAIIKHESTFNRLAENKVTGARGLMQLMPYVAEQDYGIAADKLWDASMNIATGVAHLTKYRKLIKQEFPNLSNDDLLKFTLMAYNAGIGNAKKRMRKLTDVSWAGYQVAGYTLGVSYAEKIVGDYRNVYLALLPYTSTKTKVAMAGGVAALLYLLI